MREKMRQYAAAAPKPVVRFYVSIYKQFYHVNLERKLNSLNQIIVCV